MIIRPLSNPAPWHRRVRGLGRRDCGACSGTGMMPVRAGDLSFGITIRCTICRPQR